jgi:acyl-[acyl-carrier-protein]-phospholipid O-acyltransferase/long-chain-fatty-acid--[acyl-carrier-protein] ligase
VPPALKAIGVGNIPASGPAILVANHVSQRDPELLQSVIERKIHFENHTERLREGGLVAMFPEGSPARTGSIETFGPEIETVIRKNPSAAVIPAAFVFLRQNSVRVLYIGEPFTETLTAAQLRQTIVELSCEAVNHRRTGESTLIHRLIEIARSRWDNPAITDSTQKRLSYGEVLAESMLFRMWLGRNTEAGEQQIGILLPGSVTSAVVNYAVTLAGKTAINLNFAAGEQISRPAAEQCNLKTILTSKPFLEGIGHRQWPEMVFLEDISAALTTADREQAVQDARHAPLAQIAKEVTPDSIACILFSSGSTGIPKGAELTHWNILSNADGFAAKLPLTADECMLGALPFFHSFGYTFVLWFPVLHGLRAVFHSSPTDATTIGDLCEAQKATLFLSTPTCCQQYARKVPPQQFASLKYVIVGAEKLRDSVAAEFRQHFGFDLLAGYGCTELGPGVAVNVPDIFFDGVRHTGTRIGSVGRPLMGIAVRILNPETYEIVPIGQPGMVTINGPSRMAGYFREPALTAQSIHDGYYITGDIGYVDEDGFLYITDRLARFSKIGGEMVPHLRIEEAVSRLTASFVTSVPDSRRGERLSMIYTNSEITAGRIWEELNRSGLPPLWIPKPSNIYLVPNIPMLPSGKVNLKEARAVAAELLVATAQT